MEPFSARWRSSKGQDTALFGQVGLLVISPTCDDIVGETEEQEGGAACHCRGAYGTSPMGYATRNGAHGRVQHVGGEPFDKRMRAVEIEHAILNWQLKLRHEGFSVAQGITERTRGFHKVNAHALASGSHHGFVGS